MKNILRYSSLFLLLVCCKSRTDGTDAIQEKKSNSKTESVESQQENPVKTISLKDRIRNLPQGCLDLPIDSVNKNLLLEKIVDRNTEKWLFGLEKTDSSQFVRADLLRPVCTLSESDRVLSVVFNDQYDYKNALHVFTFLKSDLKPVSSFILHDNGGDAEDFSTTEYQKIDNWSYRVTETIGRYNDTKSKDTTFIAIRKSQEISIDSSTGKLTSKVLKVARDLILTNR